MAFVGDVHESLYVNNMAKLQSERVLKTLAKRRVLR
jgi:hypothetical protein